MKERIESIYKQFCKETSRSGGILVHSSISEWHEYLAKELEKDFKHTGGKAEMSTDWRFT